MPPPMEQSTPSRFDVDRQQPRVRRSMMRKSLAALTFLATLAGLTAGPRAAEAQSVLTYHNSVNRHGLFTVPRLTDAAAANTHRGFKASVSGNVYAQPLFWQPPGGGAGLLIVATESNIVYALN